MKALPIVIAPLVAIFSSLPHIYETCSKNVVEISVRLNNEGGVRGSGVIIGRKGAILTAAHVVKDLETVPVPGNPQFWPKARPRYRIRTIDNTVHSCTLTAVDVNRDLALLHCAGLEGHKGQVMAKQELKIGDGVSIIAAPIILRYYMTTGIVGQMDKAKGKNLLDMTSGPGASGGPVFNTKGELVGIVQFGLVSPFELFGNVVGVASQLQIARFLKTVPEGRI